MTINVVILAAGASSRMGQPKQNLLVKGQTLLQHAIMSAQAISENVIVVLGANFYSIQQTLVAYNITVLKNTDWESGMASSIRTAVQHLQNSEVSGQTLFMVCDQPHVSPNFLLQLTHHAYTTGKGIIASCYNDAIGTPVLFNHKYFPQLMALNGDTGAKKVILAHPNDTCEVPFARGSLDLDTEQDYQRFLKMDGLQDQ